MALFLFVCFSRGSPNVYFFLIYISFCLLFPVLFLVKLWGYAIQWEAPGRRKEEL